MDFYKLERRNYIFLVVLIFLTACNLTGPQQSSQANSSVDIFVPADGSQFKVGDLVNVRARVSSPNTAAKSLLKVNGETVREDEINLKMVSGIMDQPWRPEAPGTYILVMVIVDTEGINIQSNTITIIVGGESQTSTTGETPTAKVELSPTPTSTITPIPTLSAPMATANTNANCRFGPAIVYDVLSSLGQNQSALIVGRNTNSSWWVIERNEGKDKCWIANSTVNVSGDISSVPIVFTPPTPTPTPVPLTAPITLSPSGDSNCIGFVNQAFSWQAALGNVTSYRLVVQKSSTSASGPFENYKVGDASGLSISKDITCDSLAYYRWRVRSTDNLGNNGPWSNWVAFRAYP